MHMAFGNLGVVNPGSPPPLCVVALALLCIVAAEAAFRIRARGTASLGDVAAGLALLCLGGAVLGSNLAAVGLAVVPCVVQVLLCRRWSDGAAQEFEPMLVVNLGVTHGQHCRWSVPGGASPLSDSTGTCAKPDCTQSTAGSTSPRSRLRLRLGLRSRSRLLSWNPASATTVGLTLVGPHTTVSALAPIYNTVLHISVRSRCRKPA